MSSVRIKSEFVGLWVRPEQRAKIEQLRDQLQAVTPNAKITLSDAVRFAVSSASVAVPPGGTMT